MLDGITFSEQEFYQQQQRGDRRWGIAFNGAFVLHLLVFLSALFLPGIFKSRPDFHEVMTVDLVSLPTAGSSEEQKPVVSEKKSSPPVQKVAEPEKSAEKVVSVAQTPVADVNPLPVVHARPISIRPLKRKLKKARDTRLVEDKERQREDKERRRRAERLRRREQTRKRALARARALERQAAEEARRARAALASVLHETQSVHGSTTSGTGTKRGSSALSSALEQQYYADLVARVERLWVLPEIKKWSPSLETIVEFTVLRTGRLVNVQIAKSSGDAFFDRFARETLKKAAPMPAIPAVLRKDRLDFGFRLRPEGVQ